MNKPLRFLKKIIIETVKTILMMIIFLSVASIVLFFLGCPLILLNWDIPTSEGVSAFTHIIVNGAATLICVMFIGGLYPISKEMIMGIKRAWDNS